MDNKRRSARLGLAVVLAVAISAQGSVAAAATYQPDAMVKVGSPSQYASAYRGFGVYSGRQRVTKRVRAGSTSKFSVAYMNAGDTVDDLLLRGCRSNHGAKIRYFMQPLSGTSYSQDITGVMTGGLSIAGVDPGSGYAFLVKVKVPRSAWPGEWWSCNFGVKSKSSSGLYDIATWKVKLK